jgi:hypothetical protein
MRLIALLALALLACDDTQEHAHPNFEPDALVADAGAPDARPDAGDAGHALAPPRAHRAAALEQAEALRADRLMGHVTALASDRLQGRDNQTEGSAEAREYLLDALGDGAHTQVFDAGHNVVLRIEGGDLADQRVVLGAHYDHLGMATEPGSSCPRGRLDVTCNGAADNATGVAVVLEIAAALGRAPPRRTVELVLFDAEEDGLLGSRHHVEQMPSAPTAMVNLDMVGVALFEGAHPTFALGVEYAPELAERVLYNGRVVGIEALPVSSYFDGSDDGERSDHYPFRQAEVPAIFLSSGAPPEYHGVDDEPDVVDPDKLLRVARHALLLTTDLANADRAPHFEPVPHPHLGDARALLILGELVKANPAAVGVDAALVGLLDTWLTQLRGHLDRPPETDAEWAAYDRFVRTVVSTVMRVLGR